MKTITKLYIIAELLDYLTTFIGLLIFSSMAERNPLLAVFGYNWFYFLLVKTLVVIFVVWALEKIPWIKLMWAFPIATMIPVIINIFGIMKQLI